MAEQAVVNWLSQPAVSNLPIKTTSVVRRIYNETFSFATDETERLTWPKARGAINHLFVDLAWGRPWELTRVGSFA